MEAVLRAPGRLWKVGGKRDRRISRRRYHAWTTTLGWPPVRTYMKVGEAFGSFWERCARRRGVNGQIWFFELRRDSNRDLPGL